MAKMKMMVCPHDTAKNPERWFFLSRYLSERLGASMMMSPSFDFKEFHDDLNEASLVYSNPQDSERLITEQGFLPLARANDFYDEVVYIASKDVQSPSLENIGGQRVASVTSMLVNRLALDLLSDRGVSPAEVVDQGAWPKVVNAVSRGEFEYGFVYKDFYAGLINLSRGGINAFHESQQRKAFHMLLLNPEYTELRDELHTLLLGMPDDDKGTKTLAELKISHWVDIEDADIETLKAMCD